VLVFHEPMPPSRLAGFALVWLALAVFTWDGLRARAVTRPRPGADGRPDVVAQLPAIDGRPAAAVR